MRTAICHRKQSNRPPNWAQQWQLYVSVESSAPAHFPATTRHSGRSLLHWETPSSSPRRRLSVCVPEYQDRHFDLLRPSWHRRVLGTYRRVVQINCYNRCSPASLSLTRETLSQRLRESLGCRTTARIQIHLLTYLLTQKRSQIPRSTLSLHGVCMLRECIIWSVYTRAARKENPNPTTNPNHNSHDHCLLSKWKCRTCAHTHLCN